MVDSRGRQKRRYRADQYMTPYEKLQSLPQAEQSLKEGLCFEQLDRRAGSMSDTAWAQRMGQAKQQLLRACKIESPLPPPF